MKENPRYRKVKDEMKPGRIVLSGFLGNDDRNLEDIIRADDITVKRLEISHRQIADTMQTFEDAGKRGLGEFVSVESHFQVRVESVRGKLPCPFGDVGLYQKTAVTVKNTRLADEISFSDLQIHMIREHGFYEGKGSQYRLEPSDLIHILEISPS